MTADKWERLKEFVRIDLENGERMFTKLGPTEGNRADRLTGRIATEKYILAEIERLEREEPK